tara:strand:+ start:399 stop:749 length:351 start_codon:yes stop_codon:yes gene_type:complete
MITRQDMIDKIEDYLNTRLQDKRNATGRNWQRISDKHYTYKLPYNTLQLLCETADEYFGAEILINYEGVIEKTGKNTWQEYNYDTDTWEDRTQGEYMANLLIRIAKQREKIAKRSV